MRLLSITLRHYRVHEEFSMVFDPSRQLIGGLNESGKSTLVEAIHRGLFLRSKTGGAIQKEMVSTRSTSDPEVILCFEAGGETWHLEKRFAGAKGGTRLSAEGKEVLKDEEADAKLTELLKAESGGRTTASQLVSAWAHLWVWQGSSGKDPADHATLYKDDLVQRLQLDGVAAVMQSAMDQQVRERIEVAYVELFTATGKSKAGSKPELARAALAKAEEELAAAQDSARRLEQTVADLARTESEIIELDTLLPILRTQRATVEAKLLEVAELLRQEGDQNRVFAYAQAACEKFLKQDLKILDLIQQRNLARLALAPAEEMQVTHTQQEESARIACQVTEASHRQAVETLRQARFVQELGHAQFRVMEKSGQYQALVSRVAESNVVRVELEKSRSARSELPLLTNKDLNVLRKLDREMSQATAALEAMLTGVELLQTNTSVWLDGEELTPGRSRVLADVGELVIGESVRLRIRPGGGGSLAEARARAESAQTAFSECLHRHGLRDLDVATAVFERGQALDQEVAQHEMRWAALGGAALAEKQVSASDELERAQAELKNRRLVFDESALPPVPKDLMEARVQLAEAQQRLADAEAFEANGQRDGHNARKRLQDLGVARQKHQVEIATARQALRDLETRLAVLEESHGDAAHRQESLTHVRQIEGQARAKLHAIRESLAALAPESLRSDADRFQRALEQQQMRRVDAETRRSVARDRLSFDGSRDPQAELDFAQVRSVVAREHYVSESRRAKAVEMLHRLFDESRDAIDSSVVEPLTARISAYLQCLFGVAVKVEMNLSDTGVEGLQLIRRGGTPVAFSSLSGGAKEQVAAAVRLAMAEILAADHDGCLPIVFDDAFAFTDPERVQSIQRMLDLAALRGLQVIVLTCSPADYSAFGAKETRMKS